MANTNEYKVQVEAWFRNVYLANKYPSYEIKSGKVDLVWGGKFEYDGLVFENGKRLAVYCLSCSEYKTAGGKGGAGKFYKIQADILKMVGTFCQRKVLAFAGKTMLAKVVMEQKNGRLPKDIHCEFVELPPELIKLVQKINAESVKEVTPDI